MKNDVITGNVYTIELLTGFESDQADSAGSLTIVPLSTQLVVPKDIWDSWSGLRWVNDKPFHGPVFYDHTDKVYDGPRQCSCQACQSTVHPTCRQN